MGLEVHYGWWKHLSESGDIGELGKMKDQPDHLCGTTRLVIAALPYSEFGIYYQTSDYGQMEKQQAATDKQLEEKGWKRRIDRDSEIRDPWSHVEHKYFTVSHRGI